MNGNKRNTVLFVDDEEINLFLFEKTFEKDFPVITASSGIEALEKIEEYKSSIKVVISDMRMPLMNGLELIQKIKNGFPEIRSFILTGYGYNPELESALDEKLIDRLFHKPFEPEKIKEAVYSN